MGNHPCLPARERPRTARKRGYSFGWRLRQSICEDDGKRGRNGEDDIGYDGNKKVKGRKRHIIVDTLGHLLGVFVSAANLGDREGAKTVLEQCRGLYPRLKKLWADGGYTGDFVEWVSEQFDIDVEIVLRSDDVKGFVVIPHRWVVERTFAWLGRYKRLLRDYELCPLHSESMIYAAMTHLLLRRLAE